MAVPRPRPRDIHLDEQWMYYNWEIASSSDPMYNHWFLIWSHTPPGLGINVSYFCLSFFSWWLIYEIYLLPCTQMDNLMRKMEDCIQLGTPVLLVDILEEIDPSLEPVLSKALITKGSRVSIFYFWFLSHNLVHYWSIKTVPNTLYSMMNWNYGNKKVIFQVNKCDHPLNSLLIRYYLMFSGLSPTWREGNWL